MMVKENSSLLTLVTTVKTPAIKRFVVADAFGPDNPFGIKFSIGDNFKKSFSDKVEKDIPAAKIAIYNLREDSFDPKIMASLKIKKDAKTKKGIIYLAQFHELIKSQSQGKGRPFQDKDFMVNLGYAETSGDNLWAVGARWCSFRRFWYVDADSVEFPIRWSAGFQVVAQVSSFMS